MKILFICGSLEPGRDGVGDYTRRLACELIQKGHKIAAVALNDKFVDNMVEATEKVDEVTFPILRVPSIRKNTVDLKKFKEWINKKDPEWISLQFVPYAFHKKGVPWGVVKLISSIGKQYRYHVMFHEIWLDSPDKLSQYLIRKVQKLIIKRLIDSLNPELVNVSIEYNKLRLKTLNIPSKLLRLFGNIPPTNDFALEICKHEEKYVKILYFGAAPRGAFKEELLKKLKSFSDKSLVRIQILVVCGNSPLKNGFVASLRENLSAYNVEVLDLGFLPVNEVSYLLRSSTVGIVRSLPHFLGKSGSAVSMLEHGLPIWMPKLENSKGLDFYFRPELIFGCLEHATSTRVRLNVHALLPRIADEFIEQLT